MQWLVHAPPAVAEALIRHEHKTHVAEGDQLQIARENQWDLITTDADVAMQPFGDDKRFVRSIVLLQLANGKPDMSEAELAAAVDRLFTRYNRLTPGRLYTVTASRVKVRQLPKSAKFRPRD